MQKHVPGCDGEDCKSDTSELRRFPIGKAGNLILCVNCFMAMRRKEPSKPWPAWYSLAVVKVVE